MLSRDRRYAVASIFLLALAAGLALLYFFNTRAHENAQVPFSKELIADYGDFRFAIAEEDIHQIQTGLLNERTGEVMPVTSRVFVRASERSPVTFRNLSEGTVEVLVANGQWDATFPFGSRSNTYRAWRSMLQFKDGKVIYVSLVSGYVPFEFASSPDGPFVSLPMSRQRMIEVFGKPKRWRWEQRANLPGP